MNWTEYRIPNLVVLIVVPLFTYAWTRFMLLGSKPVNFVPFDYRPFALFWLFALLMKLAQPKERLANHVIAIGVLVGSLAANQFALQQVLL